MNPVIESLLRVVEADPLPAAYISSHWQHYGSETIVERRGDVLTLRASGFEALEPIGLGRKTIGSFERLSYRMVTRKLKSYPSIWRSARNLCHDLSSSPNFNVFKNACVLSVLMDHWSAYGLSPKIFALIGDGYGFLGALIRRCLPHTKLYLIDLPKMLVFQARTHESANAKVAMRLLEPGIPDEPMDGVVFVLPQNGELISDNIDCAISVASMQEMKSSTIKAYFIFLRRRSDHDSRFYCVNRLHKELLGGEVSSFYNYPWDPNDEVFLDEPCPYYRYFLSPRILRNGPRFLGVRVPFMNYFDGVHIHRLVRLAPLS